MTNTFLFLYQISAKEGGFTTKISIIRRDIMLIHGLTKNYTICKDIIYTHRQIYGAVVLYLKHIIASEVKVVKRKLYQPSHFQKERKSKPLQ